jgi:hypothetical protein
MSTAAHVTFEEITVMFDSSCIFWICSGFMFGVLPGHHGGNAPARRSRFFVITPGVVLRPHKAPDKPSLHAETHLDPA